MSTSRPPAAACLIVSDLHAGADNLFPELCTEPDKLNSRFKHVGLASLVKAAEDVLSETPPENRILVCGGDLSNRCHSEELARAAAFLKSLADALNIPSNHRLLVPGNHDIDWNITKLNEIDRWYDQHRQVKFQSQLNRSGFRFPIRGKPVHLSLLSGRLECFLLDSPFDDRDATMPHHGRLGMDQLKELRGLLAKADPDSAKLAILHHHVSALGRAADGPDYSVVADSQELREILRSGFVNLVVHGHQHRPGFEQLEGQLKPLTIFGAGSTTVPHNHLPEGTHFNAFHVVEFDDLNAGSACGRIHTRILTQVHGWHAPGARECPMPPVRPFGHLFAAEQIQGWVDAVIAICETRRFVKLNDYLNTQTTGAYLAVEDFMEAIRRSLRVKGRESNFTFLQNDEYNYWQLERIDVPV